MEMLQHFFFTDVMCCAYLLTHVWLFCDLRDCNLPGSSAHGILQAGILEWVAMPSSRGSYHQGSSQVSHSAGRFCTVWATREARRGDGSGLKRLHEAWSVQPVSVGELELEPATVLLLNALLSVASLRIILTQVIHLFVWQSSVSMYGPFSDLIVKSEERGSETLHHLLLDLGRAVVFPWHSGCGVSPCLSGWGRVMEAWCRQGSGEPDSSDPLPSRCSVCSP